MRVKRRQSILATLLILGIGIPGSIGIFVVQAKAVADQSGLINAVQVGGTSTSTPTRTQEPLPSSTSTLPPLNGLSAGAGGIESRLYAYIQAPVGPVPKPYVILKAFSAIPQSDPLSFRGYINSQEFVCDSSSCVIYMESSSRFVFRAYSARGAVSDEVIASVSVSFGPQGYSVTIDALNQFTTFQNACSRAWGVLDEANVRWDDFVQVPYELNTRKTLHSLATELLLNGIVDASDCPAGGLGVGLNWPTACGLERASSAMIEYQNQYDDYIWLASRDQGIPPKILKTLIEVESQFWPGNQRFFVDEFGLGQINQLGVDVVLRKDPTLYQRVCPSVLASCSTPYISLSREQQAMIRGAVISLTDATCATCDYGLDIHKAQESVSVIAMVLKANCQQVENILKQVIKPDPDADAATATAVVATVAAGGGSSTTSYEDLWRFTLASYHTGLSCFNQAVVDTKKEKLPLTWENVSKQLKCKSGVKYVDGFMDTLFVFDTYRYQAAEADIAIPVSTIIPTRTVVPTPTVYISRAQVRVQVFMDRNGNKSPDSGEWIDAMSVLLTTSRNEELTLRTQNGIAIFNMTGYPPGIGINVSLPGLYRSESFTLPEQGEVLVTFMFEQPVLPTSLP